MRIQSCLILMSLTVLPLGLSSSLGAEQPRKPELANWIDRRYQDFFESQGLRLTTVDDVTFLRRAYLDLSGRIPTVSTIRDFAKDSNPDKRSQVVHELLADERFGMHMARVWRRVLMPAGSSQDPTVAGQRASRLDKWLRAQIDEDTSFDEVAARLVTAGGADKAAYDDIAKEIQEKTAAQDNQPVLRMMSMGLDSTPVDYLQHTGGDPASMASSVSRVFLGVRLECAQCHDHPFTDWTQQDFWGVATFFAGARLSAPNRAPATDGEPPSGVIRDTPTAKVSDADGNSYSYSLPWDDDSKIEIPKDELPRQFFARWMTSQKNPQFAATIVNRVWEQLCGSGLTDSVDDLDQATKEERSIVLDDLAARFAQDGYNLKELVRAICLSDYYQRTSQKQTDKSPSPRPLKVMTPEQLFDSFEVAVAMPISSIDNGPRYNGEMTSMVNRLEEAVGSRPDDFRSGIPQALTLMNGKTTADATDLKRSRMLRAVVDAPFLNTKEKVDTLFMATLGRKADEPEREKLMAFINDRRSEQEKANAFSEVMWALINSEEFVLVR